MNSNFLGIVLLMFGVLALMSVGSMYNNSGMTEEFVLNVTSNISSNFRTIFLDEIQEEYEEQEEQDFGGLNKLVNIMLITCYLLLLIVMEFSMWAVEFGYLHPQFDYLFGINLFMTLLYVIFGIIILLLLVLLGYVIYCLYHKVKEKRKKKQNEVQAP